MIVEVFENIIFSEYKAKVFLKKYCWKKGHVYCIRCNSYRIYRTAEKRYRCKRCGYTFHDFTGRWINKLNISLKQWLWIIKFFELELPTNKIAEQVSLSYPTALKACNILRSAIATAGLPRELPGKAGESEVQEVDLSDGAAAELSGSAAVPVFGIAEKDSVVSITEIPGMTPEMLMELDIRKVRQGSIVYTDRYEDYDALIFCGYSRGEDAKKKRFTSGRVYISGISGFWSWARERLVKFHGISKEYFPIYIKELELRYNNRDTQLFETLVKNVCQLVPKYL